MLVDILMILVEFPARMEEILVTPSSALQPLCIWCWMRSHSKRLCDLVMTNELGIPSSKHLTILDTRS